MLSKITTSYFFRSQELPQQTDFFPRRDCLNFKMVIFSLQFLCFQQDSRIQSMHHCLSITSFDRGVLFEQISY
jgi:hypothetical protein